MPIPPPAFYLKEFLQILLTLGISFKEQYCHLLLASVIEHPVHYLFVLGFGCKAWAPTSFFSASSPTRVLGQLVHAILNCC